MKKNGRGFLLLGGMFALAFLPWIWRFWADPDLSLTWSKSALLTDELYHGGNALKAALSGGWLLKDFNYIFMDPLMPLLQRAAYMASGISLLTARLPAVFLNMLLALLLVWFVYRYSPRRSLLSALTALFLISTNYYFFIYGRLALIDLPMAALGLASMFVYHSALQADAAAYRRRLILSGTLLYLALIMKASAANIILAYLIFALIATLAKQITRKRALHVALMVLGAGMAQTGTLHIVRILLGAKNLVLRSDTLIKYKLPHGIGHSLRLYLTSLGNGFIVNNIALLIVSIFVIVLIIRRMWRRENPLIADSLMFALFLSTFIFHGFFNYHPPRYYIILVVPLTWFAATLPWRADEWGRGRKRTLVIVFIAIFSANAWNLYRYGAYLAHPGYSFIQTARKVGQTIRADSGEKNFTNCILYDSDVHTGIPFYLAINFDYGLKFSKAELKKKKVYLISAQRQSGFKRLGEFRIYDRFKFNLYRVSAP